VDVIDANVALYAFSDDPLKAPARTVLAETSAWRAPDIFLGECANALARLVRVRRMSEAFARDAMRILREATGDPIPSASLVAPAFGRALALNHGVFDCIYLEAARASGSRLITADRRLVEKLRGTSDEALIIHLSERRH
jgi:predicted nucleic acid-binding protein